MNTAPQDTPELLAPCGSPESVCAAVRCGADAVYIGLKHFSARQNAANFDDEQLDSAVRLCHLYGVKVYIAVNTLLLDSELDDFIGHIKRSAIAGVDAFIVQDLAAAYIIRQALPTALLHASTQMTIHSPNGVKIAKQLGFSRVVAARELNSRELLALSSLDCEIEAFVHGSLCMSVSGQCYLSAMIGGRSANRGLCAQPCRLPFKSSASESSLSLSDLSLLKHIDELKKDGVCSLKIEGRMKRPEYVAAACDAYSLAIDGKTPDTSLLEAAFSRGSSTDGYFTGQKLCMNGVRTYDNVLATQSSLKPLAALYNRPRKLYSVDFTLSADADKLFLYAVSNGFTAKAEVDFSESLPSLSQEIAVRQLSKLGSTVFTPGEFSFSKGFETAHATAAMLNDLRREVIASLEASIIDGNTTVYDFSEPELTTQNRADSPPSKPSIRIQLKKPELLKVLPADFFSDIQYVLIPLDYCAGGNVPDYLLDKIIAVPPRFLPDDADKKLAEIEALGFDKLLCTNISHFAYRGRFRLFGDFSLNITNSVAASQYAQLGAEDLTLSIELNTNKGRHISQSTKAGIIAYGRLPLMLTANCPLWNNCKNCNGFLTDRTGRRFTIICPKKNNGMAEVLNSETLYLADKSDALNGFDFVTLMFTDESAADIIAITNQYRFGSPKQPEHFTRGLYYRGI